MAGGNFSYWTFHMWILKEFLHPSSPPGKQFLSPSLYHDFKNNNPLAFPKCSCLSVPQLNGWLAHHVSTFSPRSSNLPVHLNHLESFRKLWCFGPPPLNSDVIGRGHRLGIGILKLPKWFWCAAKFGQSVVLRPAASGFPGSLSMTLIHYL